MPLPDSNPSPAPSTNTPFRAVLQTIGSLKLTVLLLISIVAICLWGTVVEKNYGATAAKFGVYGAWWFNAIGAILAINSTSSLILHLPWKKQQLGFILPHLGLVVMLVGCFISRHYGFEGAVTVVEGLSSNIVYKGSAQHVELDGQQHFALTILPDDPSANSSSKPTEPIIVPFTSGPFNWQDYSGTSATFTDNEPTETLPLLPWRLAHRDRGVLYDRDGIRLEVVDYLSNSRIVNLPNLTVSATPISTDGRESSDNASMISMEARAADGSRAVSHPFGVGSEKELFGESRVLFWMTGSTEETDAFRQSKPDGALGKRGRVVLFANGKPYQWAIDGWKAGDRRALGDSGMEVELLGASAERGEVRLKIHRGTTSRVMLLSAENPERTSQQDYEDRVFGSYWYAPDTEPKSIPPTAPPSNTQGKSHPEPKPDTPPVDMAAKEADATANTATIPPRIDLLLGADQQIYLRTWRAGKVTTAGPLKLQERVVAFADTPDAVALRLNNFNAADRPENIALPLPFDKTGEAALIRQARLKMTIDGEASEFWLPCLSYDPQVSRAMAIPVHLQHKIIAGKGRHIAVRFEPEVYEMGLTVHLRKAWRKLDPGNRQASFYASEIDLLPVDPADKHSASAPAQGPKYENLLVTLNAPLDFTDPVTRRSYRMFQTTMNGPVQPEEFGIKMGDPVYVSGLTLNYDPGRGLTYLGCLLICAGIFVAYFIRLTPSRNAK